MPQHFWLVLILLLTVASGACSESEAPAQPLPVLMRDFSFEPSAVSVRVNQRVRFEVTNSGSLVHDFTIERIPADDVKVSGGMTSGEHGHMAEALAVHLALEPQRMGSVGLTPTGRGRFTFYCTVPSHRAAGMEGAIEVTE